MKRTAGLICAIAIVQVLSFDLVHSDMKVVEQAPISNELIPQDKDILGAVLTSPDGLETIYIECLSRDEEGECKFGRYHDSGFRRDNVVRIGGTFDFFLEKSKLEDLEKSAFDRRRSGFADSDSRMLSDVMADTIDSEALAMGVLALYIASGTVILDAVVFYTRWGADYIFPHGAKRRVRDLFDSSKAGQTVTVEQRRNFTAVLGAFAELGNVVAQESRNSLEN